MEHDSTQKLFGRGFLSLIWTQFFGAVNDNILKGVLVFMLVDGVWQGQLGMGGQGYANFIFTLPFILFSGYAGRLADRHSKRDVALLVKIIEIPIALIGMMGFWTRNLWITLLALAAISSQSAFFGPAKYGMIPELVGTRELSRANGTINMMTNLAVILGTLIAGLISDLYSPLPAGDAADAPGKLWLPGAAMLVVAAAGLISVMFLPRLKPGDKAVPYEWNPVGTYVRALRELEGTPLFTVMFAWAFFYFLAGLTLLVLPEYTMVLDKYDVSRSEVSILLAVLGVAIGFGCALAGLLSGHAIRPRLVPMGGVLLAVFFFLLGTLPPALPDLPNHWRILASTTSLLILGAGFSAGFYIVPLQALLQHLAPRHELGRFLGTANGLSFGFLLLSSLLYPMIRPLFDAVDGSQHPNKMFLVASALMIAGVIFFVWRAKRRGFSFAKIG
jgi:acyl-[acyl-carrier-protein]-phospholipid O-acyltransferase/long-chain-fatty-acid--[acyl-carrier-protein] ligase